MTLQQGIYLQGVSYNYIIEKVLGQGAFGITYLAKLELKGGLGHLNSNFRVTIKEFFMKEINGREGTNVTSSSNSKGGLFYEYKEKFAREARNLSKLQHPNIVNVMEYFEANGTCYYVMEYLCGGDLDSMIETRGGLTESECIRYSMQIGEALLFMHNNKMLHLDLKPKNVMLNDKEEAILIDFGLSKQYDKSGEPESSTKVGMGTPGYAPLEQANYQEGHGFPVTMDVYAFGATMFKMLTGKCAPEASVILNDGFPVNELSSRHIGEEIIAIIEKAMAPMKKNRYQSVEDMLNSLKFGKSRSSSDSDFDEEDWGEYYTETISKSGEARLEKHKVAKHIPLPESIVISVQRADKSQMSYTFYLNKHICNSVIGYINDVKVIDDDFYGGIYPEVVEQLKRNGFFSQEHWENEDKTAPLYSDSVSVEFLYADKSSFKRYVKYAPTHRLLYDAVNNLIKNTPLNEFLKVNKKKNKEEPIKGQKHHSKSTEDNAEKKEENQDRKKNQPKKTSPVSRFIMSLMLFVMFGAFFWAIWTPEQEFRKVGSDSYYSYYIVGTPSSGWDVYKWNKIYDNEGKIKKSRMNRLTKEHWDSISFEYQRSEYQEKLLHEQLFSSSPFEEKIDKLKSSNYDKTQHYLFFCKTRIGNEYVTKDTLDVAFTH